MEDALFHLPQKIEILDFFGNLSRQKLIDCLKGNGPDGRLFEAADRTLREEVGPEVFLRGLIEISNVCRKNCFYCGLRRDNHLVSRYTMPVGEIKSCLKTGYARGLRSFLLQSGELLGRTHFRLIEGVLQWCRTDLPDAKIVLSVGELPFEEYDNLLMAGAHRYLLRIETSSPALYSSFHPADENHTYSARLKDIQYLRGSGWQTGTGVLIGLPSQTVEYLADDLMFMKDMDVDMIGMGPYIENSETPLWEKRDELLPLNERISLTLRMISLARLLMPRVNIAATTALQTACQDGLERGLMAGANVVMPNLTPLKYREKYNLYHGKTVVGDTIEEIISDLDTRSSVIGRTVEISNPGDPLHFTDRMQ
jgi:biotin synthase